MGVFSEIEPGLLPQLPPGYAASLLQGEAASSRRAHSRHAGALARAAALRRRMSRGALDADRINAAAATDGGAEGGGLYAQRKSKRWSDVNALANPPPSAAGPLAFAHEACQTDNSIEFDEIFGPLITEMVNGAILDAQRSLADEEALATMEGKNRKLQEVEIS